MHRNRWIVKLLSVAIGVVVVLALVIGARSFGRGNLVQARQIAVRLQAAAIANPNPAAIGKTPAAATAGAALANQSAGPSAVSSGKVAAGQPATATAPGATAAAAGAAPGSATPARGSAPTVRSSPGAAATVAPRRQPTSAEIGQAIIAVHSLIPFFTPSVADIAATGNQVCTALDQGQSFSQVKSAALDMVGAGSYAWAIPSSVPEIAIRTVVALYCPANASKLV